MQPTNSTGICYITLNDQKLKLRFGIPACRNISELLVSDNAIEYFDDGKLSEMGIAKLIYFAYLNECLVSGIAATYGFDTFVEFVEQKAVDGDLTEITEAAKTWADSKITKKMLTDMNEAVDDAKKKP